MKKGNEQEEAKRLQRSRYIRTPPKQAFDRGKVVILGKIRRMTGNAAWKRGHTRGICWNVIIRDVTIRQSTGRTNHLRTGFWCRLWDWEVTPSGKSKKTGMRGLVVKKARHHTEHQVEKICALALLPVRGG